MGLGCRKCSTIDREGLVSCRLGFRVRDSFRVKGEIGQASVR